MGGGQVRRVQQPSHHNMAGPAASATAGYMLLYDTNSTMVTERGGEKKGQGEDEGCKLCVDEDRSHGC